MLCDPRCRGNRASREALLLGDQGIAQERQLAVRLQLAEAFRSLEHSGAVALGYRQIRIIDWASLALVREGVVSLMTQ